MSYEVAITAGPDDIDELGHVNNAVWVQWVQEIAVAQRALALKQAEIRSETDAALATAAASGPPATVPWPDRPSGVRSATRSAVASHGMSGCSHAIQARRVPSGLMLGWARKREPPTTLMIAPASSAAPRRR